MIVHLATRKAGRTRVLVACGLATYSEVTDGDRVTRCRSEVTCRSCRGTRAFRSGSLLTPRRTLGEQGRRGPGRTPTGHPLSTATT